MHDLLKRVLVAPVLVPVLGVAFLAANPALAQEGPPNRPERQEREFSPEQFVERMMAADTDGDGKLSREEMPERFGRLFDRADGDSDGFLSRAELGVFAADRQGARRPGSQPGRPAAGRPGQPEARPEPSEEAFEDHMGQAGRELRVLRRSAMDDESIESDLQAAEGLVAALQGAKTHASAVPMSAAAKDKFGDDTKAYHRAMRIAMIRVLREALAMELALLEGKGSDAKTHLAKAREIQGEAHGLFQEQ